MDAERYLELADAVKRAFGLVCCAEHEQHVFTAPRDDTGRLILPVPPDTRCDCGKTTLAQIEAEMEAEVRDEETLARHHARWGSHHRAN